MSSWRFIRVLNVRILVRVRMVYLFLLVALGARMFVLIHMSLCLETDESVKLRYFGVPICSCHIEVSVCPCGNSWTHSMRNCHILDKCQYVHMSLYGRNVCRGIRRKVSLFWAVTAIVCCICVCHKSFTNALHMTHYVKCKVSMSPQVNTRAYYRWRCHMQVKCHCVRILVPLYDVCVETSTCH